MYEKQIKEILRMNLTVIILKCDAVVNKPKSDINYFNIN